MSTQRLMKRPIRWNGPHTPLGDLLPVSVPVMSRKLHIFEYRYTHFLALAALADFLEEVVLSQTFAFFGSCWLVGVQTPVVAVRVGLRWNWALRCALKICANFTVIDDGSRESAASKLCQLCRGIYLTFRRKRMNHVKCANCNGNDAAYFRESDRRKLNLKNRVNQFFDNNAQITPIWTPRYVH